MPKTKLLALSFMAAAFAPAVIAQEAPSTKVYLEADTLIDDQENGVMIAEGDVVARYEGRELSADKVIYNIESKTVRAIGNVRITDPDGTVRYAEELEVDDRLGDGVATEFAAQLPQDALVVARAASRSPDGSNKLDHAIYTACEICAEKNYTPTWSLRARRAVQNAKTKMITYEDAVFELKGVPILYFPYFAHPDPTSGRRSGLLPPTPGLSSKLGLVYEQPYYWAISPSQDLTITPKLHTNVNPTLGLEYRKRFYSGEVEADVSLAYDYEFDSNGDRIFYNDRGRVVEDPANFTGTLIPSEESVRSHIFAQGLFEINEDWKWGFGLERVSDDLYLRRYDIDGKSDQRGIYDADPLTLLSQVFVTRQTENFYADAAAFSVQGLKANDRDDEFGVVTPIMFAEQLLDYGKYGLVSLQGSTSVLNRSEGNDTRRVTALSQWENSYIAPAGLVFEPLAQVRADYYDYSFEATTTTQQVDDSDSRTTGLVAATLRYPMIRRSSAFDMTIEPIAMVAYSETSLENGFLPNEDSQSFEYSMPTAFEPNAVTGYDLVETGGRIAAGVRTYADFRNGFSMHTELARRWRDEADPAFSTGSNLNGKKSDYLLGTGFRFGEMFEFDSNFRLDDDFELHSVDATGSVDFWRVSASATYFDIADSISYDGLTSADVEGIKLNAELRVTDHIDLLFAQSRNIAEGLNVSRGFGIQFSDDCSFFRISYVEKELNDRGVGSSESIKFAFGLKTIGEVSDNTFD